MGRKKVIFRAVKVGNERNYKKKVSKFLRGQSTPTEEPDFDWFKLSIWESDSLKIFMPDIRVLT